MSNTEYSLLQCPICFEEFVKPKALPCLHTFCKLCIGEYIQSVANISESKVSFQCPLCRKDTNLTVCLDPAENLPDNFIINNLKLTHKTEFDSDICKVHEAKAVEFFCSSHDLLVCSKCLLSDHRPCSILEISEALETRKNNITDSRTRLVASRAKIEKQVDSLTNRKRETGINIDQCKSGVKLYVKELRNLFSKAETQLIRKLDELKEKQITSLNNALSDTGDVLNGISMTLKEIEDANVTASHDFDKLQNCDKKISFLDQKIRACELALIPNDTFVNFEPNMDLFKTLRKDDALGRLLENSFQVNTFTDQSRLNTRATSQHKHDHKTKSADMQHRQNNIDGNNKTGYRSGSEYVPRTYTLSTTQESKVYTTTGEGNQYVCKQNGQKNLGTHSTRAHSSSSNAGVPPVEPTYSTITEQNNATVNAESGAKSQNNPDEHCTLNIKTMSDKKDCFVTGIAVLQDGSTIVADYGNTKLKLFNSDYKIIKEKVFTSEPWSVCLTENRTFLVSFPSDNLIQFFTLKDDRIITTHEKISTPGRCYGLSYHDNKIAVSVRRVSGSSLFLYNNQNLVLSEIQISSGTDVSGIWYLTFTRDGRNIVYTDEGKNLVVSIEWKSKKQNWKHEVNQPRGIAVVGSVLCVVSRYGSSCFLYLFSEKGSLEEKLKGKGSTEYSCIGVNHAFAHIVVSCMNHEQLELFTLK